MLRVAQIRLALALIVAIDPSQEAWSWFFTASCGTDQVADAELLDHPLVQLDGAHPV
jgi:hypothetical protein